MAPEYAGQRAGQVRGEASLKKAESGLYRQLYRLQVSDWLTNPAPGAESGQQTILSAKSAFFAMLTGASSYLIHSDSAHRLGHEKWRPRAPLKRF